MGHILFGTSTDVESSLTLVDSERPGIEMGSGWSGWVDEVDQSRRTTGAGLGWTGLGEGYVDMGWYGMGWDGMDEGRRIWEGIGKAK